MTNWQIALTIYLIGTILCVVAFYLVMYNVKREGLENNVNWPEFYKTAFILALFSWFSIFGAVIYHILKNIKK